MNKVSLYAMPDLYQRRMSTHDAPDKAQRIISFICHKKGIPVYLMKDKTRRREVNYVRQLCIYVIRQRTPLTLEKIALLFSRTDHTTIINALQSIENYKETDKEKREDIKLFLNVVY